MNATPFETAEHPKAWMPEIERLKGLAIILVVWGHVYHANLPASALALRTFIYSFHMPVFMFMSGYVLANSGNPLNRTSLQSYISKRFKRLMIPFFALAMIVIVGKIVAQKFLEVRGQIFDISAAVLTIFVHTDNSPVVFIWYLAVLFEFSVISVLLLHGMKFRLRILIAASLLMYAIHLVAYSNDVRVDIFYFDKALLFYSSFVLGILVNYRKNNILALLDKWWPAAVLLVFATDYLLFGSEWRYLVVGSIACLALFGLSRSPRLPCKYILAFLGKHSFAIYLLNMPFIGLTMGVLMRLYGINSLGYSTILLCVGSGLIGPVGIKLALQSFSPFRPVARAIE